MGQGFGWNQLVNEDQIIWVNLLLHWCLWTEHPEVDDAKGLLVLRIFNPNLFPDLLHQLRQEKSLIQSEDWTLLETFLEALAHVLSFVSEASGVVEVEGELGLRIRIVEGSIRSIDLLAAPEWGCHGDGSLGPKDTGSVAELDLKLSTSQHVT